MADFTVAHRQPLIQIPRDPNVEPGAAVALYWNGSIARNGDGYVPAGGAAVNFSRPLFGPSPMWLKGHPHLFGGGFGLGGFGEPGCDFFDGHGFGMGPFGIGAFGVNGGFWTWRPANNWRNGIYRIVARLRDAIGNEQSTAIADITVEVAAPPRPSPSAWIVSVAGTNLNIAWRHSPDFEPV